MIDRDYFKRQATTLRKLVTITRNPTVADRLIFMAQDFDTRADDGSNEADYAPPPSGHGAIGRNWH